MGAGSVFSLNWELIDLFQWFERKERETKTKGMEWRERELGKEEARDWYSTTDKSILTVSDFFPDLYFSRRRPEESIK